MPLGRGALVTGIGAAILLAVLGSTGYAAYSNHKSCPPAGKSPPRLEGASPSAPVLYAVDGRFGINDRLCVAWRPKAYFAKEVAQKKEREQALAVARASEAAASDALARSTVADRAAAEQAVKAAAAQRLDAEAKLSETSSEAEVALFIDELRTGDSFRVRVPGPGDADIWKWETISLRAPENYSSDAAKDWRTLLRGVGREGARRVKVGLGDPDARLPRPGAEIDNLKISAFEWGGLLLGAVGFVTTMTGLVIMGWNTAMLRVRAAAPGAANPPFSLSRVQMVWWFALTLGGFLFIWLTTGQWMGVMTPAVVALLGISGVSGLAAITIDTNSDTAGPGATTSRNFFFDLLSDGSSIVLQRVQMFTWTIVLGLIFLWSVIWNYALPQFDSNLLVLAGIVNGVYLGFKFPENKQANATAANPPP